MSSPAPIDGKRHGAWWREAHPAPIIRFVQPRRKRLAPSRVMVAISLGVLSIAVFLIGVTGANREQREQTQRLERAKVATPYAFNRADSKALITPPGSRATRETEHTVAPFEAPTAEVVVSARGTRHER